MTALLRPARLAGLLALVIVLALLAWWRGQGDDRLVVTADFTDVTGLYVGNQVQYLGVPIGKVSEIAPRGTVMRVRLEIDGDTELPAGAGATILQSSLVTDRHVELGPAYVGGPRLVDGAHIEADHTRSPAGVDEIARSVDELIVALDETTPGGNDIGDLLRVTARTLKGNGTLLKDAVVSGEQALGVVNARGDDLTAVTRDLATLVDAVARRDASIRGFADGLDQTTAVVAEQRHSISGTLASLDELTRVVERFVRRNQDVIGADLAGALRTARQLRQHQGSLAEAFDTMPTLAENLARAYDWKQGRLRVQFNTETGPFSAAFRAQFCEAFAGMICATLFRSDGSGLLDFVFDDLHDSLPGNLP